MPLKQSKAKLAQGLEYGTPSDDQTRFSLIIFNYISEALSTVFYNLSKAKQIFFIVSSNYEMIAFSSSSSNDCN